MYTRATAAAQEVEHVRAGTSLSCCGGGGSWHELQQIQIQRYRDCSCTNCGGMGCGSIPPPRTRYDTVYDTVDTMIRFHIVHTEIPTDTVIQAKLGAIVGEMKGGGGILLKIC